MRASAEELMPLEGASEGGGPVLPAVPERAALQDTKDASRAAYHPEALGRGLFIADDDDRSA